MNDTRRLGTGVSGANAVLDEEDSDLAEWAAELEQRIELLEGDITLLCKAVGLAGLREKELLHRLGLPDDTLQRHNAEVLAQAAAPFQQQR